MSDSIQQGHVHGKMFTWNSLVLYNVSYGNPGNTSHGYDVDGKPVSVANSDGPESFTATFDVPANGTLPAKNTAAAITDAGGSITGSYFLAEITLDVPQNDKRTVTGRWEKSMAGGG